MKNDCNILEGRDWKASFDLNGNDVMRFDCSGKHIFSVIPVSFGPLDEASGINTSRRPHHSRDGLSMRMETVNLLPFGPEPSITRAFEFASNCATVTCDIDIKKGISGNMLSVDSILLPGNWEKIGLIENTGASPAIPAIRWHDAESPGNAFYSDRKTFLSCILKDKDGLLFEIGTGDDLWRWNSAPSVSASSSFSIEKNEKGILISRNVFQWETEIELPARNWRFNWYFAWSHGENIPYPQTSDIEKGDICKAVKEKKIIYYDFLSSPIHGSGMSERNGEKTDCPCMKSRAAQNHFRKLIRSLANRLDGHDIRFMNISPRICDTAAHLERKSASGIEHWDMISILDLRLWANRQVHGSGSVFSIVPPPGPTVSSMPVFQLS